LFEEHPADIVFHLAGYVGGLGANKTYPGDFFYRNLMMGAHTLHYAWKTGAEKVVAAGAGCGYPESAPLPIKESDYWNGYPQDDSAPYSLAKRMLHVQSFAYWRQYNFPILVAIPGNIYGAYDNFDLESAHVIPALVRKFVEATDDDKPYVEVWGTGKATRDFCYAGDVAEVLRYNREFHFTIFDLSPLNQVRREAARLWQMSEGYSAAWWRREPKARNRINSEHKAIITALRKLDLDRLVEISAVHRIGGHERSVTGLTRAATR